MRIDIVVFDGFDELDAVAPYEVFGHARDAGADVDVAYVGVGKQAGDTVTASHGTTVAIQRAAGDAEVVLVPGGGWQTDGPGARAEARDGGITAWVRARHEAGALVTSVCTGAMLLAESGILEGRRANTHHGSVDDLPGYGVTVVGERVVDDGDVVTAGGVTSGIDLALHVVERLFGPTYADHAAAQMEHDRVRVAD